MALSENEKIAMKETIEMIFDEAKELSFRAIDENFLDLDQELFRNVFKIMDKALQFTLQIADKEVVNRLQEK